MMKKNIFRLGSIISCLAGIVLSGPLIAAEPISSGSNMTLLEVVKITLQHSPDIKLQQLGVEMSKADVRMASGAFNVNTRVGFESKKFHGQNSFVMKELRPEDRAAALGMPEKMDDMTLNVLSAGLSKSFRTGISADLSASTTQTDPDMASLNLTSNKTHVETVITIPLLKGSGRVSAAADETAANLNYKATIADYQHSVSTTVLDTITAFGNYGSALWYLEKVRESQQRIQTWIDKAGHTNDTLHGYLEDKKGKLIDAQQALEEAEIALADIMGIPVDKLESLGQPAPVLTRMNSEQILNRFDRQRLQEAWFNEAKNKRLDLKATRLRQEASKVNLDKARKDRLPSLDLTLGAGYNGFAHYDGIDHFTDSFYQNVNGMDYGAGFNISYPLGNDVAGGTLDRSQADYQQQVINTAEKIRSIGLSVQNELNNLYGRMKKDIQVSKTVRSYQKSLENMQGDSSVLQDLTKLLTVMELENKFLEAMGEEARALTDLLTAIAKSHFTTGTLIVIDDSGDNMDLVDLNTLPGR